MSAGLTAVAEILGHPLTVLLTGTALTALVVPRLSDRRERSRKALDIDVGLTERITESVAAFLMAIQFAVVGPTDKESNDRLDTAYKDFMVTAAVIRAKLATHHPERGLGEEWDRLTRYHELFYALTGIPEAEQRAAHRSALMAELRLSSTGDEAGEWLAIRDSLWAGIQNLNRRILRERRR